MNFYKEFFKISFEISFAVFIMIFGYNIWNTFDQTSYEIAKYYENNKEFELYVNEDISKLYLHNISDDLSCAKLLLKTSKDNNTSFKIVLDNITYDINDLEIIEDNYFNYYKINEIDLNGYETKELDYKVENENQINFELVATI